MAFGIAGTDDVELRSLFFDEGDEVAGVFEAVRSFTSRRFVAAKGQDVFDASSLQLLLCFKCIFFGQIDAGHVGYCFTSQGFYVCCDFRCAVAAVAAGSAGHADEVRMDLAQFIERRVDGFDRRISLWRENFERKDRLFCKKLMSMHTLISPSDHKKIKGGPIEAASFLYLYYIEDFVACL